jgi:hypothetical protein
MRREMIISVAAAVVLSTAVNAFAKTYAPPFKQCPPVGAATSCKALIVVSDTTRNGRSGQTFTVQVDPAVSPFDGIEDTLVGIQNDSRNPVAGVTVFGAGDLFGFDGDGLCAYSSYCYGPTGYEGPGVSFNVLASGAGEVHFASLAPGASTFFGLESAVTSASELQTFSGSLIWGSDTATVPDWYPGIPPRAPLPMSYYAGRVGSINTKCYIHGDLVVGEPQDPFQLASTGMPGCIDFHYSSADSVPPAATFAYWFLSGENAAGQATWLLEQAELYAGKLTPDASWELRPNTPFMTGNTLFADIEEPFPDWWPCQANLNDPQKEAKDAGCKHNRDALNDFFDTIARSKKYHPGLYTRADIWVSYFGFHFQPKSDFVLWLTGCLSEPNTDWVYWADPALAATRWNDNVRQTVLGGQRPVLWQFDVGDARSVDFDLTATDPAAFAPSPAGDDIVFQCGCGFPECRVAGPITRHPKKP